MITDTMQPNCHDIYNVKKCVCYTVYYCITGFWSTDHTCPIPFYGLTATLIYYLCTVALPCLADWSAFLDWVLLTMKIMT